MVFENGDNADDKQMNKLKVLIVGLGLIVGLAGANYAVGSSQPAADSCSLKKDGSCCKPDAACCKDGSCPMCKAKAVAKR